MGNPFFNFAKIFVLGQFKMMSKFIGCFRFKQKFLIKFLLVEKCKSCEIYRRINHVYAEERFNQEIFTDGLNMH